MIKNIVFDASGLLYTRPKSYALQVYKVLPRRYGFKGAQEEFAGAWNGRRLLAHSGKLSAKEWIAATFSDMGVRLSATALNQFYKERRLAKTEIAKDNTKGALPLLKEYKLYVLSDSVWPSKMKKTILRRLGLLKHFDDVFHASELGVTKHFPRCFRKVLRATGNRVAETLFVGHQMYEIASAKMAGLTTVSLGSGVGADYEVASLRELAGLVEGLNKK